MRRLQTVTALVALSLASKAILTHDVLGEETRRSEGQDAANAHSHQTAVNDIACRLQFIGNKTIVCKSRWHDIRLPCKIRGSMTLTNDDLAFLLPDEKMPIGTKWQIDEKFSAALAKRLFTALKITAENAQTYAHWTGSGPQTNPVEAYSQINGILHAVQVTGKSRYRLRLLHSVCATAALFDAPNGKRESDSNKVTSRRQSDNTAGFGKHL